MPMLRTVECDICGTTHTDKTGHGFPDWINIQGVILDGNEFIWLCPKHRNKVMDYIDEMKNGAKQ